MDRAKGRGGRKKKGENIKETKDKTENIKGMIGRKVWKVTLECCVIRK
jgi:hypothetical protein